MPYADPIRQAEAVRRAQKRNLEAARAYRKAWRERNRAKEVAAKTEARKRNRSLAASQLVSKLLDE